MSHWQIRFRVPGTASEALGDTLSGLGALAVTMENGGADEFYEAAYPQQPDWPEIDVTGLFDDAADTAGVVSAICSTFPECTCHDVLQLEDRNWERSWLDGFEPVRAGRDLWIVPSWLEPPVKDAVNIIVDPGLAFGTGTHPTTRLCLGWLDRNRPRGAHVIDFGCGSGILAIAALKLGAARAWGVDVDPRALVASRENAERNEVVDQYSACTRGNLPGDTCAHLVIANILARVLIDLRDDLRSLVCDDGVILLTGILSDQAEQVRNSFEPWFEFSEEQRDEWSLLIGTKCND